MRITFIGAAQCVTGSCTLLEHNNIRILIDCGLSQGHDANYSPKGLQFNPRSIDFVLLTHAHIDHSGKLPLMVKGETPFEGKVLCTKATAELCRIMLPDSAHIQEQDAKWQTKHNLRSGKKPVEPLYSALDADEILKHFESLEYNQTIPLGSDIEVTFTDAGHMLGSSSISLRYKEKNRRKTLVFSGDIGNLNQPIINDPTYLKKADYVAMESTYGDRDHASMPKSTKELADSLQNIIDETFANEGKVIIPAFSVGRSQEILYILRDIVNRTGKAIPTYLDSPLSVKATATFMRNVDGYYDEEAMAIVESGKNPILFNGFHAITDSEESKMLNTSNESCVIISSSGMCEAGRIRHHLKHNLYKSWNTVVFTGYQAPGTLGHKIQSGVKAVSILGEKIAVRAKITKLEGISGHADRSGLLKWIDGFEPKPKQVFVIHGDGKNAIQFAQTLEETRGIKAFAPASGTKVDL